jgi:hypothetical protein
MVRSFAKILLSIFLVSTAAYAADMDGKLEIYAPLEIEVKRHMVLPSVFVDHTGKVSSEDNSSIPSGHNGTNAIVCINGEANKQYTLSFPDYVNIGRAGSPNADYIQVELSMGNGAGGKTNRKLSTAGGDCASIMGAATLNGITLPGHYVNITGSVPIEAMYDAM